MAITGSEVVALNRVVAVWHARGAEIALGELGSLRSLDDYHLAHAVRGELPAATGRVPASVAAFRAAAERARVAPERELIEARIIELAGGRKSDVDSGRSRSS